MNKFKRTKQIPIKFDVLSSMLHKREPKQSKSNLKNLLLNLLAETANG